MIIGKESEVIHGIGQKDDCEIFLLKAAEHSLPTFASTAVCQDTAKATVGVINSCERPQSETSTPVNAPSLRHQLLSAPPVGVINSCKRPQSETSTPVNAPSLRHQLL
ncbi:hypothetical protein ACOMHN_015600 [Nucella lapillus]